MVQGRIEISSMAQLGGFIALDDAVAGGESQSVVRRYLVSGIE
jgi:hypothetical protein